MVAHTLCPDHTRTLCDEFQALDRGNQGTLTLQAFGTGLLSAPSVANGLVDLTTIFNTISISKAHGHGTVLTYHEYIAAAMVHRIELEEERVLVVFNNLDPGTFYIVQVHRFIFCQFLSSLTPFSNHYMNRSLRLYHNRKHF